jgi:hypothetical protein
MEAKGEREWSVFVRGASSRHRQRLEEKGDEVTLSVPKEVGGERELGNPLGSKGSWRRKGMR